MSDHYILEGREAKKVDLMTWARWFESNERRIALTEVGDFRVSTVFLGLNHNWGDGPPLLFETMIFRDTPSELWADRCSTYDEAEAMHERGCDYARKHLLS